MRLKRFTTFLVVALLLISSSVFARITNFPNGVSSFGVPVVGSGSIPSMFGKYWFVDYANGSDGNTGETLGSGSRGAFQTLSKAYAVAVTDRNDVIVINGDDPVEEDTMITWAKNKIHVVGLGVFGATDQEPRIVFSTTGKAAEVSAVLKVTGWGNTFTNIRINNWTTYASAKAALWDAGEGTVYTNCQFSMMGLLASTTVSDVEARGDSTTWRNCKFGTDTLQKTVDRGVLLIKGTGGSARMKNNVFEDCYFTTRTDTNTITLIDVYDTNSLAFVNIWKDCIFTAPTITSSGDVQLLNAVESVGGLAEGELLFVNPTSNAASFCTTNTRVKVQGASMMPTGDATAPTATIGVAITPN